MVNRSRGRSRTPPRTSLTKSNESKRSTVRSARSDSPTNVIFDDNVVERFDFDTAPSVGDGKLKRYTWQQVAKHNTAESAWVILNGRVYDITTWLDTHPGGRDSLLIGAGRDCTLLFNTYHSEAVQKMLPRFEIGVCTNKELPDFPERSPLHANIKKRLRDHFRAEGVNPKNSPWIWLRYLVIWTLCISCTVALVQLRHLGLWLGCAIAVLQGCACALEGLMPLHDASHFSITKSPLVWKLVGHTHDFINGASYLIWMYQHVLGHHIYCNVDGADPDIETKEVDFRRIKPWQRWLWPYVAQHIYTPIAYCLLAWKTRVQDVTILLGGNNGAIRLNPPSWDLLALFVGGKLCWFLWRIVLPAQYLPLWQVLLYITISDLVTSWYLALSFQVNHVAHGIDFPLPDKTNRIQMDWAELQMRTTQDYAHHSWLTTVLTGALNLQVTHHLVPGINQFYYRECAPIIREEAARLKIPYNHLSSFWEALGTHVGYLRHMGQQTAAERRAAEAASKKRR